MDTRYRLAQEIAAEMPTEDPTAESRKKDHIDLAFKSQVLRGELDSRFYYEPLLAAHPKAGSLPEFKFLGKNFRVPLWVSSMTGGTALANAINKNLARACAEFGMGMGLGSCRQLLFSDEFLGDFAVRKHIGDQPLFANLGIAQLENLIAENGLWRIKEMLKKLEADGLIVHVNPLQEAMQPEGDVFKKSPIETINTLLDKLDNPLIVKEVGQGFGPESLRSLLQLPLAAIEFAAAGGTNFAKLELLRDLPEKQAIFKGIAAVGHSAEEMVFWVNQLLAELGEKVKAHHLIISGGVQDFLDGYYLTQRSAMPAVYGQASAFLRHAQGDYDSLQTHVQAQVRGLELANAFLRLK